MKEYDLIVVGGGLARSKRSKRTKTRENILYMIGLGEDILHLDTLRTTLKKTGANV